MEKFSYRVEKFPDFVLSRREPAQVDCSKTISVFGFQLDREFDEGRARRHFEFLLDRGDRIGGGLIANAEFATLRLRLLKIAARVVETASRVRLAFAEACPEAGLFRSMPGAFLP